MKLSGRDGKGELGCLLSNSTTTYDIESGAFNNLYRKQTSYYGFYFGDFVHLENGEAVRARTENKDRPFYLFVSYVVQRLKIKEKT